MTALSPETITAKPKEDIRVAVCTFQDYDDEEMDAGGSVQIFCGCGYSGYVEADTDGKTLSGDCIECDAQFTVNL